jgi:hypothetical protein
MSPKRRLPVGGRKRNHPNRDRHATTDGGVIAESHIQVGDPNGEPRRDMNGYAHDEDEAQIAADAIFHAGLEAGLAALPANDQQSVGSHRRTFDPA